MMDNKRSVKSFFGRLVLLGAALGISSTSTAATKNNTDPYEGYNRVAFRFNDSLDNYLLKPVAKGYNAVIPSPVRSSVNKFYHNIDTVPVILNDLLQANFYQASSDTWRLVINSTVGIFGLFDPASHIGLEPNPEEDLGLTFAQWGWRNSNYFVIPFFGPSTVRDTLAKPIEYQYMSIYPWLPTTGDIWALYSGNVINARAQLLKLESVMRQAAVDKYVFQRNAYLQHRAFLIQQKHNAKNPSLHDDNLDDYDYDFDDKDIDTDADADAKAPGNENSKAIGVGVTMQAALNI